MVSEGSRRWPRNRRQARRQPHPRRPATQTQALSAQLHATRIVYTNDSASVGDRQGRSRLKDAASTADTQSKDGRRCFGLCAGGRLDGPDGGYELRPPSGSFHEHD